MSCLQFDCSTFGALQINIYTLNFVILTHVSHPVVVVVVIELKLL